MSAVLWTGPALNDLESIDDYWTLHSPERADWVLESIDAAAQFLRDTPRAGMPIAEPEIRKWRVKGTDYLLLYRLQGSNVQILRVFHDRQNWLDFQ